MRKILVGVFLMMAGLQLSAQDLSQYDLRFKQLPTRWDEALPLGNGMLGALVWQKGDQLRFSLDRADLWDYRKGVDVSKFNFKWVEAQVFNKTYDTVQKVGDDPYEAFPYPTKIPAAALELNTASLGKVTSATLDIKSAKARVVWANGAVLETFVHATEPFGSFRLIHAPKDLTPEMLIPSYQSKKMTGTQNSVAGQTLAHLGYAAGKVQKDAHHITYTQPGSLGFHYEVSVNWAYKKDTLVGVWSIASYPDGVQPDNSAEKICLQKIKRGFDGLIESHLSWWKNYWDQSSVLLPDSLLQKQYYLEMYKLGAVARVGAPPITLQAVWTADNGSLPPWKGDIHNDLNTQLSYWPAYAGNHLAEAASFTDWLWKVKPENERYTKQYFGVSGLDVPGVATLQGKPMGGWIQYSLSPTVSAWLAQHFYWQYKYSMDPHFLKTRAYPYLHAVATFLSGITSVNKGIRQLPLSSSPEIHDNDISAWFTKGNTNYDVSLMRFAYGAAAEMATAVGKKAEAAKWENALKELPQLAVDSTGLMVAPGADRIHSHRHHSNLMAIYPLGLLNPERAADKIIIDKSLRYLEKTGTSAWCGYSFSWAASLYARAKDGAKAARELRIFATNFCSPNSFHLNGDQKGGEYSSFTYRPFTLEGNFAFAKGVQEMLLQDYSGIIEVFPAVPDDWKDISFHDLRTEGAFLVSADREGGQVTKIDIVATAGGTMLLKLPFRTFVAGDAHGVISKHYSDGLLKVQFKKGGRITVKNGYE